MDEHTFAGALTASYGAIVRKHLDATLRPGDLDFARLGSGNCLAMQPATHLILERRHKASLIVCLAAMVFCWTQAIVRSHYPPSVRSAVTAAARATESVVEHGRIQLEAIVDGAHKVWAAAPVEPGQTSQDRVEPFLPIAETIAGHAGGFFPYSNWFCLNSWHAPLIARENGAPACTEQSLLQPL
jgi:hypothetical protein